MDVETDGNKKEKRKRQKQLFKDVKKQMEFYFSNANMRKDRFMRQQVDLTTDGYVDLSIFGNFNKLRALTKDLSLVAKALTKSDFLQVSEDGKKVKRIPPIPEDNPCDVDERTVYVECLPPNTDHDSLTQMFSACGQVSYVSLPKYQTTKDIKGFAFIEFSTVEAAQKACQMLNNPPANADKFKAGKFPTRGSKDYQKLKRQLSAYNKHGNRKQKKRQSLSSVNNDQSTDERCERQRTLSEGQSSDTSSQTTQKRKGKRKTSGSLSDSDIPVKLRRKSSGDSSVKSEISTVDGKENDDKDPVEKGEGRLESKEEDEEDVSKRAKRKRKHSEEETTQEQVGEEEVPAKLKKKVRISEDFGQAKPEGDTTMLEMKREKKKKRKGKKKSKELKEAAAALPELRVIPKTEWVQLKREYLDQQKSNMASFKQSLIQLKQTSEQQDELKQTSQQDKPKQRMKNTKPQQKKETPLEKKEETKKREIEYVPGVIVKLTSTQMLTRKDIKERLKNHADIAYIDMLDGQSEGHIRCADAGSATRLAENGFEGLVLSQLIEKAESSYWEKIKSDQEIKLSTKSKGKKRGSQKIADKAEKTSTKPKHIVFD